MEYATVYRRSQAALYGNEITKNALTMLKSMSDEWNVCQYLLSVYEESEYQFWMKMKCFDTLADEYGGLFFEVGGTEGNILFYEYMEDNYYEVCKRIRLLCEWWVYDQLHTRKDDIEYIAQLKIDFCDEEMVVSGAPPGHCGCAHEGCTNSVPVRRVELWLTDRYNSTVGWKICDENLIVLPSGTIITHDAKTIAWWITRMQEQSGREYALDLHADWRDVRACRALARGERPHDVFDAKFAVCRRDWRCIVLCAEHMPSVNN